MKISRGDIKDKISESCRKAKKEPVFITRYNLKDTVMISQEVFNDLKDQILEKYKEVDK